MDAVYAFCTFYTHIERALRCDNGRRRVSVIRMSIIRMFLIRMFITIRLRCRAPCRRARLALVQEGRRRRRALLPFCLRTPRQYIGRDAALSARIYVYKKLIHLISFLFSPFSSLANAFTYKYNVLYRIASVCAERAERGERRARREARREAREAREERSTELVAFIT